MMDTMFPTDESASQALAEDQDQLSEAIPVQYDGDNENFLSEQEIAEKSTTTPKRAKVHPAWMEVTIMKEQKKFKCNNCGRTKSSPNVSNIMKHLQSCNKDLYELIQRQYEPRKSKTKSIKTSETILNLPTSVPYPVNSREYQTRYMNLAITLSCPNNSVHEFTSGTPLRQLIERLDPRFQFPTSEDGLKGIMEDVKEQVIIPRIMQELESVEKCVSWSTFGASKAIRIRVVICYLNSEGELLIRFLKMENLTQAHTGTYIRQLTDQILESYGIDPTRVIRYVTDSGANVKKAFSHYFETFDPLTLEAEMEDDDFAEAEEASQEVHPIGEEMTITKWFACVLHTSNRCLSCTESQNLLDPAVEKLLNWLKKLRKSSMHQIIIERSGVTILIPPRVRWAYLAIALKRALKLKDTLSQLFPDSGEALNADEWSHIEKTENVYSLFFESMKKLQYVQDPTMSQVYPTIMCLMKELETIDYALSRQVTSEIERRFVRIINSKDTNFEPFPLLATLLDPSTSFFVPEKNIEFLIDILIRMVTQEGKNKPQEITVTYETNPGSQWAKQMLEKRLKALETPNIGLKKYLRDWYHNTSPPKNRVNPIKYWLSMDNQTIKPLIPVLYEIFACLPSTSIIESYFSSAGELTIDRKNRTGPHLLDLKMNVYLNRHIVEECIVSIE